MFTSEKDRSNSLALFISTEVCKNASSHVREEKNNYNAEMQKPGENNAKKKKTMPMPARHKTPQKANA
jgi:hypothetical protein